MFKVHYIVSAAVLEKLINATDNLGIGHSNIEHLRQADRPEEIKQLQVPPKPIEPVADAVKNKRSTDADIVSLTNKRPTKDSMREKVVVVLEKLEVKHGIGGVTRKMLRAQCKRLGLDPQILYQLTADGYIVSEQSHALPSLRA